MKKLILIATGLALSASVAFAQSRTYYGANGEYQGQSFSNGNTTTFYGGKPARPVAILRLIELGLETTRRSESLTNRAGKASEMAAQAIDRLSDPSATDEERQIRKRRLIKGPKEFRGIGKKSRGD
jgi:hypothetical protein